MGVQVIVGQGWPHGEERFGRWSGEERKDLEGGQEASKVLKPADFDLHSISNGKPWKASEQDMGNSTLGLSLSAYPPHLVCSLASWAGSLLLMVWAPVHQAWLCRATSMPSARLSPTGYHHCPLLPDKEELQKQKR